MKTLDCYTHEDLGLLYSSVVFLYLLEFFFLQVAAFSLLEL